MAPSTKTLSLNLLSRCCIRFVTRYVSQILVPRPGVETAKPRLVLVLTFLQRNTFLMKILGLLTKHCISLLKVLLMLPLSYIHTSTDP